MPMTTTVAASGAPEPLPRVWLILGQKAGDNEQVLTLAESLGWPYEIKRFTFKSYELWSNLLLGPSLLGVDKKESCDLGPPWPDLIITAGRRNEPVSRWVQAQAQPKEVKLVHLGRPWAPLHCFDLIVTTPQYQLPMRENVLVNPMPMHRVSAERLAEAATEWRADLAHLPRPLTALLVGGNSGPYLLDRPAAERLIELTHEKVARDGGSLLITTSARTPAEVVSLLSEGFDCPQFFVPWRRGAARNPYLAFLALADSMIVTGDSMSMLAEAVSTEKPVYIFGFGHGRYAMNRQHEAGPSPDPRHLYFWKPGRWKAFVSRWALRFGPRRMIRDIRKLHRVLIESGEAAWLGAEEPPANARLPADSAQRVSARVRELFKRSATP